MVTRGRKFSNSKRAGRNASEPRRSLVNELEKPTLWSEGEGRWMGAEITEVASIDSRVAGSACTRRFIAQCWRPVLGVGRPPTAAYKETKTQRLRTGVGGVHSTV